jgi:hypothetical protein
MVIKLTTSRVIKGFFHVLVFCVYNLIIKMINYLFKDFLMVPLRLQIDIGDLRLQIK